MSARTAYEQKLQAQLDDWNADVDKLKAKADKAKAEVRIEYYEQIRSIEQRQVAARRKLDELKAAGDDAWDDLKVGAETARMALKDAIRSASARF